MITSMEKLNISHNDSLTSAGLLNLCYLTNLQCLSMKYCPGVTSAVMQSIANNNIALIDLDISWCNIEDSCLKAVSKITSLKTLNISRNVRLRSLTDLTRNLAELDLS